MSEDAHRLQKVVEVAVHRHAIDGTAPASRVVVRRVAVAVAVAVAAAAAVAVAAAVVFVVVVFVVVVVVARVCRRRFGRSSRRLGRSSRFGRSPSLLPARASASIKTIDSAGIGAYDIYKTLKMAMSFNATDM